MRLTAALATLAASVGLAPTQVALAPMQVALAPVQVAAAAPSDVCVIKDSRATELSGLFATATGYLAVNDSQFDAGATRIVFLDLTCKVTKVVRYPTPARDPEDLAMAPDGTLWVADIGDNVTSEARRQTVALWSLPATGAPVIHRLTYPDGPHDAEGLLFTATGVPIVVTKELTGKAGLYEATAPLQASAATGVPMKRVGEFAPTSTGENNLLGALGEVMVTGAATSPDRRRVVLRTYTAAYEWDVPDGDVVKAITTGTPRVTALPDEPQGEAIAYTPDGTAFLTVSDEAGPTTLRRHTPSAVPLPPGPATFAPSPTVVAKPSGLSAIPVWYALAAAGGGLLLVGVGYLGLRRSRGVPGVHPSQ